MNESCVQSMRCTCRCIESGAAGIRAVAPAHLPHPRVAGRRIMEPPLCTRPSVFSPGFFHRLATRRAAGGAPFVDRIRVGVRSPLETISFAVPTSERFASQRGTGTRSSRLHSQTKDVRDYRSQGVRNHASDIKLLNYAASRTRIPPLYFVTHENFVNSSILLSALSRYRNYFQPSLCHEAVSRPKPGIGPNLIRKIQAARRFSCHG